MCGELLWPRWESCCGCGRSQSLDAVVVLEEDELSRSEYHAGEQEGSGVDALEIEVSQSVLYLYMKYISKGYLLTA